jgi:RNA polymerase primary sigma factor
MRQLKISTQITQRDSASIEKYLTEISRESLITAEEEAVLARKIRTGDQAALDKMVKANLRFVVSVAKQYQNQGLPLSDLINEGNMGLIRAAKKFDETKGFKFISYAVWWIRQAILQALVEQSRMIRLPLNKVGGQIKLNKSIAQFEQQNGREPNLEELAGMVEMSVDEVRELLKIQRKTLSTDAPLGDEGDGTLLDTASVQSDLIPTSSLENESLQKDLGDALSILSPREYAIVEAYFGLNGNTPLTLEEIGERFGLTRERVRQIKEKSLRKVRATSGSIHLSVYL